jgi:hypothetical protein
MWGNTVRVHVPTSCCTVRMPRELVSPNVWNGRHWRVKHRISQDWEVELLHADRRRRRGPVPGRMRVAITREVPSRRNFIRDDDNLRFSCKPLLDALKRAGYIKDDSRTWIELPTPLQALAADGGYWTVVTLTPAEEA